MMPPSVTGAIDVFGEGLDPRRGLRARADDGTILRLPVARWLGRATRDEESVLDRAVGPVLDVGCGPGRHVVALRARGVEALGIDVSPAALRVARRRGAPVVEGSVFSTVPRAGRWRTCLLLDGNVGIGGDAAALLRRVAALMRADGRVLAEVEPPGARSGRISIQLVTETLASSPFPWARVGVDGVDAVAARASLAVEDLWSAGGRWFAELRRPG
jgi:SAM-dependent methyltransferase